MSDRPLKSKRIGQVEVSIWAAQYGVNISISKSYKDKETNQWKRTGNLGLADAVVAHRLLGDMITLAARIEDEERERRFAKPSPAPARDPLEDDLPDLPAAAPDDDEVPF